MNTDTDAAAGEAMDVERWMIECLFVGYCPKVMTKHEHIPAFEAEVRAIEARWREKPPACPKCGSESLDLLTGDGDATTDWFGCETCGAESEELGMVVPYASVE